MDQKVDAAALVRELGVHARAASRDLARASTDAKNKALGAMAAEIRRGAQAILAANAGDVAQAKADGCDAAFVDRLTLTAKLVEQMALGVEQVAALADPVGEITGKTTQPSGIEVARMRVPLGVVGIIYESRPNVTAARLPEAAAQLVGIADRAAVGALIKLREYVDIIVPRGGKELIERLARESQIPMIKHLDGVCHVYIDDEADADMALKIADNA